MRQLLQSLKSGDVELLDIPCPAVRENHLLIATHQSLISAGTERMLVEFGRASLLEKARQHPDRVKEVLDKIRSQGLFATLEAVRAKLNESIPLGYCNVGQVLEVGANVEGFEQGDWVVSNGSHAEVVCVPQNLCAKIPPQVTHDNAVFTVVGAIGLQGVRLAEPTLGESFVVTGLGLIGLLTAQLLLSNGCRVLGVDFDPARLELAKQLGAEVVHANEDVLTAAANFSRGRGVDGVLLTASCKSSEPVHQAAQMCRKRGRIVLVGVTGLELQRSDFYEKELKFLVSCSYGPGRYDAQYEEQGIDYPMPFVRWTEQRNFEAVLDQMAAGRLSPAQLITHRIPFEQAGEAYQVITDDRAALGVVMQYEASRTDNQQQLRKTMVRTASGAPSTVSKAEARIGVIGAGNFARRVLIPHFRRAGAALDQVASQSGMTATVAAQANGFEAATTDWQSLVQSDSLTAVAIATPHHTHAEMTVAALEAGKHVYVEKPLAISREQLASVVEAKQQRPECMVMTGFNRRFAPMVQTIASSLRQQAAPKAFVMTVNAGALPPDNWNHDPLVGGGRIIGEGCHFVDLLRHLCGHSVTRVQATMFETPGICTDKMNISLSFADGSIGAIQYLANGSRAFPKERLEVFCNNQTLQLDNYRRLRSFGWKGVKSSRAWREDKGHAGSVAAFVSAIQNGAACPIPWNELVEVTEVTFDIMEAAYSGETIHRRSSTDDDAANNRAA